MLLAPADSLSTLRVIVVGLALLWVPGWFVQSLFLRRQSLPPLSRLSLPFVFSVGSIACLSVAVYFLHGDVTLLLCLFCVFLCCLSLICIWQVTQGYIRWHPVFRLPPRDIIPTVFLLLFALLCSVLAGYSGTWFSHIGDDFYHLAIVRRILETGNIFPQDVLYAYDVSPSGFNPILGTWHVILALYSLLAGVDIAWLWWHLPILIAPLLVISFYAFAITLLRNSWIALLGTVLHFVFYAKLDFRASVWPNQVGFILLWTAFILVLAYQDSGALRDLIPVGVLVFVMVIWHLLMAEFFFVGVGAYLGFRLVFTWITYRRLGADQVSRRLGTLLVFALLVGAPLLLFRTLQGGVVHVKGDWMQIKEPTFQSTFNLRFGFSIIGPRNLSLVEPRWRFAPYRFAFWLLGYVASLALIPKCLKRDPFALFALSNTLIVPLILLNPFLITFLQGKMTDIGLLRLVLLPPYGLVIGWFLWYQSDCWLRTTKSLPVLHAWSQRGVWKSVLELVTRGIMVALITCILGIQGADNLIDLFSPSSTNRYSLKATHIERRSSEQSLYSFVIQRIVPGSVIASDPINSYYLSGMTGRPVISVPYAHYPPHSPISHAERQDDSYRILDGSTTIEDTIALLDKYDVCAILLDSGTSDVYAVDPRLKSLSSEQSRRKLENHPELFEKIFVDSQLSLYHYLGCGIDCVLQ